MVIVGANNDGVFGLVVDKTNNVAGDAFLPRTVYAGRIRERLKEGVIPMVAIAIGIGIPLRFQVDLLDLAFNVCSRHPFS